MRHARQVASRRSALISVSFVFLPGLLPHVAGFYEVRVQGGGANHRLFCLLDRNADDLGGPSLICLDGLSKPVRSAASPRDYRRVRHYADECLRGRLLAQTGPELVIDVAELIWELIAD